MEDKFKQIVEEALEIYKSRKEEFQDIDRTLSYMIVLPHG